MNREILFRGKRVDNDEWVYGDLLTPTDIMDIWEISENTGMGARYEVESETVGQFTGLTDKNGNKIFEGDIVKSCFRSDADKEPMTVEFHAERGGWFPFACGDGCGCCEEDTYLPISVEVIGNVYDNKEEEK